MATVRPPTAAEHHAEGASWGAPAEDARTEWSVRSGLTKAAGGISHTAPPAGAEGLMARRLQSASRPPLRSSLGDAGSGGGVSAGRRVGIFFKRPGRREGGERACAHPASCRRGDCPPSPSARAPPPSLLTPPLSRAGVFLAPPELRPPWPLLLLSQPWVSLAPRPPLPLRSV